MKSWQDSKDSTIISRLDLIIGEMELMARQIPCLIIEGEKRAAAERAKSDAEYREFKKKRNLESRQQAEEESRDSLRELIKTWADWRSQQEFLNELTGALEGLEPRSPSMS